MLRPAARAAHRLVGEIGAARPLSTRPPTSVQYGKDEGITLLTLDRAETRNAISRMMLDGLREHLHTIRFDGRTRVLILNSAVPYTFCSGADLKERRTMTQTQVNQFLFDLRAALTALEDLPMPTLAAIEGPALGGGLELALACDLRVASASVSKIGLPETSRAIIPGAGGTQRLARLVGLARAKDLIFTSRLLSAQEALRVGIVDRVSAHDQTATEKAVEMAKEMTPNGPIALGAAKMAITRGTSMSMEAGLDFERECYNRCLASQDRREGLAAFAEKRKPQYKGE
ncbi:uncharacterized protein L969DRAFT_92172 [Mixia osmundae IAM 14324]|uniref:Enoyl-CoA hydratase n=1 Tax=Mixia osmundae (strain CBS 9802 / IAM 14324 / JCM 22182 / KY 12970) TaxID=764103 RepID=G7DT43_MIXOS|nr:uncharacterized protein L969DRAFT_92172 [Mixia osmundae IAM 14324]KEI42745.1 hypothetical protein L969DRAFT_92172 [Mixia osmundae IAM 14324]GAA93922.1 hypothetical protein E5Q_00568 [Mixia osmundae IAM 14324]